MLTALHFLTHVGLSWIVANAAPCASRDRWLVVTAGVLPDLDGVGILWSETAYATVHRAAGHGLVFIVLWTLVVVRYAERPVRTTALALLSFHLHLLLDAVGTGGLPIRYFWPLSDAGWTYAGRWTLASWPNAVVMAVTLLGVLLVAYRTRISGTHAVHRGDA
jgi:membrane-bound metal-dependent hydrolase YbcI (DUF457 family)